MKESRSSISIMQLFIGLLQFNAIEKKIYLSMKMFNIERVSAYTRNHKLSKCELFFASVLKAHDVVFCEKRNCILVLYVNLMCFLESLTSC
jgi:hypothetical protein